MSELGKQKVPIDVFIVDQKMESDEEDAQSLQLISSFHDHYPDAIYLIISGHITRKQWFEFQENMIEEKFNGSLT